jgi:hypothetical protein
VVYIGLETGHSDAKFARASMEHTVRAGCFGSRAVVVSTCVCGCLPAEAQSIETIFELAVPADCFGGGMLAVSASA